MRKKGERQTKKPLRVKEKEVKPSWWEKIFSPEHSEKWLWGMGTVVVLWLIFLFPPFFPGKMEPGEVATQDIRVPQDIRYIDEEATRKKEEREIKNVPLVYDFYGETLEEIKGEVEKFFALLEDSEKELKVSSPFLLPQEIQILRESKERVKKVFLPSILSLLQKGVVEEKPQGSIVVRKREREFPSLPLLTLEEAKRLIGKKWEEEFKSPLLVKTLKKLSSYFLVPNVFYNAKETERRRKEARERVKPVWVTLKKGEVIARYGSRVTPEEAKRIELLAKVLRRNFLIILPGMFLLVFLVVLCIFLCSFRFSPRVVSRENLPLIFALLVSTAFMGKLVISFPPLPDFLIPIGFLAILGSVLLEPLASLFMVGGLSVLFGMSSGNWEIFPPLLLGGMIGIYRGPTVRQRTDLTNTGILIGLVSFGSIFATGIIRGLPLFEIFKNGGWGILSGFLSGMLAMAVLPYLESWFDLTTDIKLVELSNLNHPLLKRLSVEAPGTYHHTIGVANLAEAGAEAIGANSLLARVSAYYHDIGKIIRPHFFFENRIISPKDTHSEVTPNLSAKIIISHVKDGLEFAERYKLPKKIKAIIREHHGKSLIAWFYRKAIMEEKQAGEEKELLKDEFRYPGPKPQSKEAAVVMLADSVEAAFRATPKDTPKGIYELVKEVIENKLKEGQLEESELSLGELSKIADAFTRVLTGALHGREEYPARLARE